MSRLFEWAVNTLGKALAWSMLAGVLCGAVAIFAESAAWVYLGFLISPLVFALILATATSPLPYTDKELGLVKTTGKKHA